VTASDSNLIINIYIYIIISNILLGPSEKKYKLA
jgi:hypothetical protein